MSCFKNSFIIVGSLRAGKTLLRDAAQAKKEGADWIELRLDALPRRALFNAAAIVKALRRAIKLPIIVTVRSPKEQGPLPGLERYNTNDRRKIFEEVLADADYIDLEFSSSQLIVSLLPIIRKKKKKIIFSYHDFKGMPTHKKILSLAAQFKRYSKSGDILKVAVTPKKPSDAAWLLQECAAVNVANKAFIAMGKLGRISRLAGFAFGSALTYASSKKSTAPGQWTIQELVQLRKKME